MTVTVLKCPSCGAMLDGNEQKCKFCRSTLLFDDAQIETQKKEELSNYELNELFLEGLGTPLSWEKWEDWEDEE